MENLDLSMAETIQYIEKFKNFLDQEWLKSERQQSHPLVKLIHLSNRHMDSINSQQSSKTTDSMARLCLLGIATTYLKNNNAKNLDKKIKELMSDNHTQIEKTMYEIIVSYVFSFKGRTVEFVNTESDSHRKTYDLLIDSKYAVECKKLDPLTKHDIAEMDNQKIIQRKSYKLMDKLGKNACIFIHFKNTITTQIRNNLLKEIRKLLINNALEIEQKDYKIKISFMPKNSIVLDTPLFSGNLDRIYEIFRNQLPQIFESNTDNPNALESILKESDFMKFSFFQTIKSVTELDKLRSIGFKMFTMSDRMKSLLNAIKHAKTQLNEDKINFVCVDAVMITNDWVLNDYSKLNEIFNNNFYQSSSISGIVLLSDSFSEDVNSRVNNWMPYLYKNHNASNPIPDDFEIIG